jgi:predicted transcriptional regulator
MTRARDDAEVFVELLLHRHDVLAALVDEPRSRHVLVDALPDSKTTVYKGVSQLLEAGLLVRRGDTLHPTLAGRVALEHYHRLTDVARLPALLDGIPADALDPIVLEGCELVTPDEGAFDRHIQYGERLLGDAERITGVAHAVSEDTVAAFTDAVTGGVSASLVLPTSVAAGLATDYPDQLSAISDAEDVAVYATDRDVPVGVFVVERAEGDAMVVELTEGALPVALLLNDSSEAVEWGRETIERSRDDATLVFG